MWERKLVWMKDSVEFTFNDQVTKLEESIQKDELRLKATMKNGNQIRSVELRMTLKTVSEENNNPVKAEKQEYHEQGSLLDPIKLEEENNELTDAYSEETELGEKAELSQKQKNQKDNVTDAIEIKTPGAKKKRKRSDFDTSKENVIVSNDLEQDLGAQERDLDAVDRNLDALEQDLDAHTQKQKPNQVITIASDTESNAVEEEVEGDSGQSDPDAKKRMNLLSGTWDDIGRFDLRPGRTRFLKNGDQRKYLRAMRFQKQRENTNVD